MRRFSSGAPTLRRALNARPLVLRRPVEPRAKDVTTPADHPLWQFFGAGREYLRPAAQLDDIGAAWTVPMLRRKSFEDLHTLWYVCLKEDNRLARESRLLTQYENGPSEDTKAADNKFEDVRQMVRTTMWRVRHVLSERYHAFRSAETFALGPEYPALLGEFRRGYLGADATSDNFVNAQLERFQFAFFGINPLLEGNFPEPRVVQGLYTVADLKLTRFASEQDVVTAARDVREAFVLFSAEPTPEGIAAAIKTIVEVRASGEPVPKSRDVEVLAELMVAAEAAEA